MSASILKIRSAFNQVDPNGMRWRGDWNIGTNYQLHDVVVAVDGQSYICIAPSGNVGDAPPANPLIWAQMSTGGGGGGGITTVTSNAGSGIICSTVGGAVSLSSALVAGPGITLTPDLGSEDITIESAWYSAPAQTNVDLDGNVIQNSGAPTDPDDLTTKGYVDGIVPTIIKDATEFYVSANGSDTTGTGSIVNPYATIQYAINQAALVASAANMAIVNVAPGVYVENLTITNGYITLSTQATNENLAGQVRVNGTVTITIGGADDLFGKQVSFIGFQLGYVLDDSTAQHTLGFQNCYLFAGSGGTHVLYVNSTCTDQRVYLQNCSVQSTAAAATAVIEINNPTSCWLEIDKCDVTATANIPCILMSGASRLQRAALCSFTNTVASANLAPLIVLNTTGVANAVGNCTLLFSSGTVQAADPNICGIFLGAATPTPPAGVYNLLAVFNVFALLGTSHPNNHAISNAGPNTPVALLFQNGAIPGLTDKVESGITTAQLNLVS